MAEGLRGALALAVGRPEGVRHFGADLPAAARSFRAAGVALPGFLCLHLMDVLAGHAPGAPWNGLVLDLLGYAIGWAGFALLSHRMAAALGRSDRWPRYIAAWNWCNVVQYVLLIGAMLPVLLGMPGWLDHVAGLVALFWAVWLEWFTARVALEVGGLQAAGLVLMDIGLGVLLSIVTGG